MKLHDAKVSGKIVQGIVGDNQVHQKTGQVWSKPTLSISQIAVTAGGTGGTPEGGGNFGSN